MDKIKEYFKDIKIENFKDLFTAIYEFITVILEEELGFKF